MPPRSRTTPLAALAKSIAAPTSENRLVIGQCPAWVLQLAASKLSEPYDQESQPQSPSTRKLGERLGKLLATTKDEAAGKLVLATEEARLLVNNSLPFGWRGSLTA
jgi:hypothetical protein